MSRRPTIIDVAKRAGVSKSTVSLVLRKSAAVRQETSDAVQRAMVELGYVYNRAAANMRSGGAGLIGVVINDIRNPFFSEFAAQLQSALARSGYVAMMANTDEDADQQDQMIEALIQHGVSALVISSAHGDVRGTFDRLKAARIPAIQVMRRADPRTDAFPFIAPNYFFGGQEATEHLIKAAGPRIIFVGGLPNLEVTQQRMSGYLDVMTRKGLKPQVYHGRNNRDFGKKIAKQLIGEDTPVDGVLCFNDFVALGMAKVLSEPSFRSFDQAKIAGFDDIEEVRYAQPPISSVRCNIDRLAEITAQNLIDWLRRGKRPRREHLTAVEFIARSLS